MIIDDINDFYANQSEAWTEIADILSCEGKLYLTDIYCNAIINRAMALNDAFIKLSKMNNYIAAPTYIRMQIDNCIYCFAPIIAPDALGLINHILAGKDLYKYKDERKNPMYEKYLVQEINKIYKGRGFKKGYEYYNDDVHLSNKHFRAAHYMKNDKMQMSLMSGNIYNKTEIEAHRSNMCAVNRILKNILLDYWLPFKKYSLEMIERELPNNPSIRKDIINKYPELAKLFRISTK